MSISWYIAIPYDVCNIAVYTYRQISYLRCTQSQNLNVSRSACSCFCALYWSQVSSREWRCSWSSADRRCSNYTSVNNNIIAYKGSAYIRCLTVVWYCLIDWCVCLMQVCWINTVSVTVSVGQGTNKWFSSEFILLLSYDETMERFCILTSVSLLLMTR